MKVMASRRPLPGYPGDQSDIALLLKKMGIGAVAAVERIVNQYFPDTVLPAATSRVLENLLARKKHERTHRQLPPADGPIRGQPIRVARGFRLQSPRLAA